MGVHTGEKKGTASRFEKHPLHGFPPYMHTQRERHMSGARRSTSYPRSLVHIHSHLIHCMQWNWDNCNVCGQQQCMIEPISVHTHAHKASHLRQVSHRLAYGQALIVDGTSTPGGQTIANIHTQAMQHANPCILIHSGHRTYGKCTAASYMYIH